MPPLKYRPGPERTPHEAGDTLKFPGTDSRRGRTRRRSSKHDAEFALERAQRRLDNLREVLGPGFGREHDAGPRAA